MSLEGAHVRTIGEGVIDEFVTAIAASPDIIVVGTEGSLITKRILVFDIHSGGLLRCFGDMLGSVLGLRVTPNGLIFVPQGKAGVIPTAYPCLL